MNSEYKVSKEQNNIFSKMKSKHIKIKIFAVIVIVLIIVAMFGGIYKKGIFYEDVTECATIVSVEPTKFLANGELDNESNFVITVDDEDETKRSVSRALYVEPAIDYSIKKTGSKEYTLKFKQNIPDNTLVKLQYVKNKITENSWAYQTQNKLSVTKVYPIGDYVDNNSAIEIILSYADVDNFEECIKISPDVEGKWKHEGKIWLFEPTNGYEEGKKYDVTISKELSAGEEKLEEDYTFNFTINTELTNKLNLVQTTVDGIVNISEDEFPSVSYYDYSSYRNQVNIGSKVEIKKFNNCDDFIEYIENSDYSKAIDYETVECTIDENDTMQYSSAKFLKVNSKFPTGYYVCIVKSTAGNELTNFPIQVNDLIASSVVTERDILVWVADKDSTKSNVNVEYLGNELKTNKDGYVIFEGKADGSGERKFVKIGDKSKELVVGIHNFKQDNYPTAYMYTDRPLYKNTDTINIWGFIPLKMFYDDVDLNEFTINFCDGKDESIKVNEDGSFSLKYDLNNHMDNEWAYLTLKYKGISIGSRTVNIQNYELQNYTYKVNIEDKNYVKLGENYEFDVEVEHITGLKVPNKQIVVSFGDQKYIETTNEKGIAHFEIDPAQYIEEYGNYNSTIVQAGINIYNGDDVEYNNIIDYHNLYILKNLAYVDYSLNDSIYSYNIFKLNTDKSSKISYNAEELYDGIYDANIKAELYERRYQKVITGSTYDEYTKTYEDDYRYEELPEELVKSMTIQTNGKLFEIDAKDLPIQKDTDDMNYTYYMKFTFDDCEGTAVTYDTYIYYYTSGFNNRYMYYNDETSNIWETNQGISSEAYGLYKYSLGSPAYGKKYAVDDKIHMFLCDSNETEQVENKGEILKVVFQENITDTEIVKENEVDYTFKETDFPGCKLTGLYYEEGRFYRLPSYYFDFDEELNEVDVEITADKEKYKPGDEVELTITSKPNSSVNVSVVNEAVFKLSGDITNILDTIYTNKNLSVYTYSSNALKELTADGGAGGGGDDEARGNFEDTAYFNCVTTDMTGKAKVKFTLPDNVTSYRVTAHSANTDLEVGVNYINIISTLDFFIQSTEPRGIKTSDDLVLNANCTAEEVFDVDYEFSIVELNETEKISGKSNESVRVNFGKLDFGTYTVKIKGKSDKGEDCIEYKVNIVESSQEVKTKTEIELNATKTINPSKNPIVLEIYNKNAKKYLEYIDFIESTYCERLDTQIAYNKAQELKTKFYGTKYELRPISSNLINNYGLMQNLPNGDEDVVLSALVRYYAEEYCTDECFDSLYGYSMNENNIIEMYLLASANQESVLNDLLYLKDEKDLTNYDKLLVTLSLEFLGDYQNAKELYDSIELTDSDKSEYESLMAIIETFISKNSCTEKIDDLIGNKPYSDYLRFAIISYFKNNSQEIGKKEKVTITTENMSETIEINGMEIESYIINNSDLKTIQFDTESTDLLVSYYYQTLIDEVDEVTKDMEILIDGDLKVGNTVYLNIKFATTDTCEVRVALPNSLRLDNVAKDDYSTYWISSNKIDYITLYKNKFCDEISIPLIVTNDGEYTLEGVVAYIEEELHCSNSLKINVEK